MKLLLLLAPIASGLLLAGPLPASGKRDIPGVANPAQARTDYMLKCQGCHQPDGSGNVVNTPQIKNEVSRFLDVEGGRAFLGRVPGVAGADLDDARLAQLLNWTLYRFDLEHLPEGFEPYTPAEIGRLRSHPLRLERAEMRAALIARMTRP